MGGKHKSPEVKEAAIRLAAGGSAKAAARQLGLVDETVSRWVRTADPALIASYVAEKRALGAQIAAERLEKSLTKAYDALEQADDLSSAKMARELMTAAAIGIDKLHLLSGQGSAGGRFGGENPHTEWSDHQQAIYDKVKADLVATNPALFAAPAVIDQPAQPTQG